MTKNMERKQLSRTIYDGNVRFTTTNSSISAISWDTCIDHISCACHSDNINIKQCSKELSSDTKQTTQFYCSFSFIIQ